MSHSHRNKGFMTPDGKYYEALTPLHPDHVEIEVMPHNGNFFFVNGQWHPDRRQHRSPEEILERYGLPPQPAQPNPSIPGVNAPYVVDQDSQFSFKLKDVIIIAGAIASAAVSWNNADGRISRLEEKVSQEMVKKIESIERKQDEIVKNQEDSIKILASQISDLERAIINSNRNAN